MSSNFWRRFKSEHWLAALSIGITILFAGREVIQGIKQMTRHESEARQHIGSMNRAQQSYYHKNGRLTLDLDELALEIPAKTGNYRYFLTQVEERFVMHWAISRHAELNSYLGVVSLAPEEGKLQTFGMMCKSIDPNIEAPGPIELQPFNRDTDEPISFCPIGWEDPWPEPTFEEYFDN